MNYFQKRFEEHPLHDILNELDQGAGAFVADFPDGSNQKDSFDRFIRVIQYTKTTLKAVDPIMVSPDGLITFQNGLSNLRNAFNNFQSNKNWEQLRNGCDELLKHFHLLPRREPMNAELELADAVRRFDSNSSAALNRFSEARKSLDDEFTSARQAIENLSADLKQHRSEFETQKGRLDQLITDEQSRFNDSQTQQNSEYTDNEKKRSQRFETQINALEREYNGSVKALEEKVEEQGEELNEEAKKILKDLSDHRERAKEIVSLIGTSGMTCHFQRVADTEETAANLFRWIAIGFMVVMVGIIGYLVWETSDGGFDLEHALFRVGMAVALIWPAWLCIDESRRHRREQSRNRRVELELLSIEPYLEKLDDSKRKAIIEKLADRYFGREEVEESSKKTEAIIDKRLQQIEKVITSVSKSLPR